MRIHLRQHNTDRDSELERRRERALWALDIHSTTWWAEVRRECHDWVEKWERRLTDPSVKLEPGETQRLLGQIYAMRMVSEQMVDGRVEAYRRYQAAQAAQQHEQE